jgi:hypothetical protein
LASKKNVALSRIFPKNWGIFADFSLYIKKEQRRCDGWRAAQLPILRCNDSQKTGARSAANALLSTSEKLHFIGSVNFPPNWDFSRI